MAELVRIVAVACGLVIVVLVLWDGFDYAVLPAKSARRARPSRLLSARLWRRVRWWSSELPPTLREQVLSWVGPLSLVLNFGLWASSLVLAFGLVQWGLEARLHDAFDVPGLFDYLYFSGVTFFTLGYGDIVPLSLAGRLLAIAEVATGFSFLALIISYFPVLSQAYGAREVEVVKLAVRADTPPTAGDLMLRAGPRDGLATLTRYFAEWEHWVAAVYQSHIAYPILTYFRSQSSDRSWLGAMTTMLDTATLMLTVVESPDRHPAQTLFSMVRYGVVSLRETYGLPRVDPRTDRVPPEDLTRLLRRLANSGFEVDDSPAALDRFHNLRHTYEPGLVALADYFALDLPPLFNDGGPPSQLDGQDPTAPPSPPER